VVIDSHEATVVKPSQDSFKLILINLSGRRLKEQCFRNATPAPEYAGENALTDVVYPLTDWYPERVNVSDTPDVAGAPQFFIDSTGASPGTYVYTYQRCAEITKF